LKGTGIICPVMTKKLVAVLIDFAVYHNWGEEKLAVLQNI